MEKTHTAEPLKTELWAEEKERSRRKEGRKKKRVYRER